MSMNNIPKLTAEQKELLLSKSPYVLPDNPSDKHFSPSQIRRKMYEGLLVLYDYINLLIDAINSNTELSNTDIQNINSAITTLQSYFSSGQALEAIKAIGDEDGNNIKGTYAVSVVEENGSKSTTYQKRYYKLVNKNGEKIGSSLIVNLDCATTEYAGIMSADDKSKVNAVPNKVDKTSTGSQVYITEDDGTQSTAGYDDYVTGDFVRRNGDNQIYVPSTPTASTHATSKQYVDGADATTLASAKTYTDGKVARTNLVSVLGEATTLLNGLMSATDKAHLEALYALLGDSEDANTVVDTINEVLSIFDEYPEGVDLVSALALKVAIADIVDNLTSYNDNKPLSANQGRVLKGLIDNIVDGTTTVKKAEQDDEGNNIADTYMTRDDAFAIGMIEVSEYNDSTGEITLTYNSSAITDITYNSSTGEVVFTY